jgi:hypothetical protein
MGRRRDVAQSQGKQMIEPLSNNLTDYLIPDDVVDWDNDMVKSTAGSIVSGMRNGVEKA